MSDRLVYFKLLVTSVIGALTPIGAVLSSKVVIDSRVAWSMAVFAILGAATQVKAWMNDEFANSSMNRPTIR